jgi:hypothetical protein
MSTVSSVQQLNRDLGDKVLAEAQQNPQAYPGKFVGIANGQVVAVADDLSEICRCLEKVEPDPANTFWVEIGRDYSKAIEIWRVS